LTRHELKEQLRHDQFKDSVAKVVEYTASHQQKVTRWVIVGVAVLVVAGAAIWYSSYRRSLREQDLAAAFAVAAAPVGPSNQFTKGYPTEAAKRQASLKAFSDVASKDGDTREGYTALYYAATLRVGADPKRAEADLRKVADSSYDVAALAKIALTQLYAGQNRNSEAQAVARSLVDHPNGLVSKDQAQVLLAQTELTTNPQDAKKILQSLKGPKQDPMVTRAVDQLSAQLAK
jgi:hypothetical protein